MTTTLSTAGVNRLQVSVNGHLWHVEFIDGNLAEVKLVRRILTKAGQWRTVSIRRSSDERAVCYA